MASLFALTEPAVRFFLQERGSPIIVKIVEPEKDPTGLADVLLGALGLTGVLVLIALGLGVLVAVGLFLARSRQPLS